jgi:hypothetical protein
VSRVLSFVGNTLFYGGLLGGTAFLASTYAVSDEDAKARCDAAEARSGEGPVAQAAAVAARYYADAREWYTTTLKGFTGAAARTPLPVQSKSGFAKPV